MRRAEDGHRGIRERKELGFVDCGRNRDSRTHEKRRVGADALAGIVHLGVTEMHLQRSVLAWLYLDRAGVGAAVIEPDVVLGEFTAPA